MPASTKKRKNKTLDFFFQKKKPGEEEKSDDDADDAGADADLAEPDATAAEAEPTGKLPMKDENYEQHRPSVKFKYPKRTFGKGDNARQRCMSSKLMAKFEWIHYDVTNDLLFCDRCIVAIKKKLITMTENYETVFTDTGFSCWNDIGRSLRTHAESQLHKEALLKLKLIATQPPINSLLDAQSSETRKENNQKLVLVIRALKYLGRQNQAIRGASVKEAGEVNSNFMQLLSVLLEGQPFTLSSMKYTTHQVLNELLYLMSHSILRKELEKIRASPFFAVMADDSSDVSNREQMCLVARWVDEDLQPRESFVGLRQMDSTTAQSIADAIKDSLLRLNLSLDDVRAQCYDGASVMSGHRNGVAAIISREYPKAVYIHCHSHSLNLAVQDSVRQNEILRETMATVSEISALIRSSPKRNTILENLKSSLAVEDVDEDGDENGDDDDADGPTPKDSVRRPGRITSFCPTRWTVRADTMSKVLANYSHLQRAWPLMKEDTKDSNGVVRLSAIIHKMQEYDFLFGLLLGIDVLSHCDRLSKALQSPDLCAMASRLMAAKTVAVLKNLRTDEKYTEFNQKVTAIREKLGVNLPADKRRRTLPPKLDDTRSHHHIPSEEKYRIAYFTVIDYAITGIERRFENPALDMMEALENCLLGKAVDDDKLQEICDLHQISKSSLESELVQLQADPSVSGQTITSISQSLSEDLQVNTSMYPTVMEVTKLLLVLPATNASSERSFSALKRLKTPLRNSMDQQLLNSLLILHIYKTECDKIDPQDIIHQFVQEHTNRHKEILTY